ncbi:Glycosyltransferase [Sphingomonas sp. EC-HK361]|uniref:glycosyltransferase family 4 protein n=1 Tax=Sphingomonas sp. EC-HK361 TaxID=2038397 RepID=UPI0012549EB3|nr:glycosyltransferase family 1 protein [Sphingomonas sp. EC-HK361]VVS98417.1 Glycosyltransferase [Sphingomonas sp. EC-HK361]
MIRFAVPPIGGKGWFGGWMYMRNLVRAMAEHGDAEIETLLFLGPDRADDPYVRDLPALPRTRIVVDPAFAEDRVRGGIGRALATGRNAPLLAAYAREGVDAAFSPAIYLGWRSEIPSIAWIPDFQHRRLPHLFGRATWWKRDIGFRAQVASSAAILLSSHDAEADCLEYYPRARGRTHVARFSVPIDSWPDAAAAWAMLREGGVPEDFVFLPNQLWVHKNHGVAIEAAKILRARGSTRCILVTGHGVDPRYPAYGTELAARVAEAGVESHFRMLGSVEHRMVQAMMIGANALVNPSRFEGWSTTVEEAKACGTPLILSDLRVHREQAPDARFFALDDAGALADAIDAAPPRSPDTIVAAMAAARAPTLERQRVFARTLSGVVRTAAAARIVKPAPRG